MSDPASPGPAGGEPVSVIGARGDGSGAWSIVLNVIWLVFSGFWLFLAYLGAALVQAITIIGIPFAVQSVKLALFSLWPFGRVVVQRPGASPSLSCIGNALWLVLSGIWLALTHAILGVILCLTIVGIPLGLGNFKLIPLALTPFGKEIVPRGDIVRGDTVIVAF
jgi:uncharacterized membrane protein YccF (DUF307 family)